MKIIKITVSYELNVILISIFVHFINKALTLYKSVNHLKIKYFFLLNTKLASL